MKLYDDFDAWFKEQFESRMPIDYKELVKEATESEDAVYELTLPIAYHNELRYTQEAIGDFTLIFLSGQIQQKINQRPIQIVCEIEDKYKDHIYEAMNDLALEMNEEIITLDNKKYRVYFNTPSVTLKFVEYGAKRRQIITMDASIILFNNILNVESLKIGYSLASLEDLKFSTFVLNYMADISSTGSLNAPMVSSIATSCTNNYTISVVPKNTTFFNTLISDAISGSDPNASIYLRIRIKGTDTDITTIAQSVTYSEEVQTFPVMQIVLTKKKV